MAKVSTRGGQRGKGRTARPGPTARRAGAGARRGAGIPLEIEITNFGPISKGKFRLRPLTVFVGPNNAGKTFAATLAHSVLSAHGEQTRHGGLAEWVEPLLGDPKVRRCVSGMRRAMAHGGGAPRVPQTCADWMLDLAAEHHLSERLLRSIRANFGAELGHLVRSGRSVSRIKIRHHVNADIAIRRAGSPTARVEAGDTFRTACAKNGPARARRANKSPEGEAAARTGSALAARDGKAISHVLSVLEGMERSLEEILPTSYYLPSVRSGLLCAHRAIVSGAIYGSRYGAGPSQDASLTGVMSEYVDSIARLPSHARAGNGGGRQEMFREVFGGSLVVQSPKSGLPRITYRADGSTIPLNLLSSSISETAPIQLFLQGKIPRTDVLVLEEPEAHLHPETQTKLARHIVRLVNSGTHVLLITHGVYFLEQLSMCVRLGQIPAKEREKLGYGDDDCLESDMVAPYLFKKSPAGGYVIQNIRHTPDDGISQDEFGRVIDTMYNKELYIDRIIGEA